MADKTEETTETEEQETFTAIPTKCNCDDEFVTSPCPVHGSPANPVLQEFGSDVTVVGDENISDAVWGVWEGFIFTCPVCNLPSIMVNKDMGNLCCNCGKRVVVKSKTVTDYVRFGTVPVAMKK